MSITRRKFLAGLGLGAGGLCTPPDLARSRPGCRSDDRDLLQMAQEGLGARIGRPVSDRYRRRLLEEVEKMTAEGWVPFLRFVHGLVRSARERGVVLGPGGGSCPGSLVLFGLGITGVDPVATGLLFERWFRPGNEPSVNLSSTAEGIEWLTECLLQEGARWDRAHFGPDLPDRLIEWERPEGSWFFTLAPWRAIEAWRERPWKLEFSEEAFRLIEEGGLKDLERECLGPYGGGLTPREWRELQPDSFEHVVASIAVSGCWPRKVGIPEKYLARRQGRDRLGPEHPMVDEVLESTYGLMLYQEQAMEIVHRIAGLSMREADDWRRAFGKRRAAELSPLRERFGVQVVGLRAAEARALFDDLVEGSMGTYCRAACVCTAAVMLQAATYRVGVQKIVL